MPREFLPARPQCVRVVYESQVPAWLIFYTTD